MIGIILDDYKRVLEGTVSEEELRDIAIKYIEIALEFQKAINEIVEEEHES